MWKLPNGDSDEERLLTLLGGQHHFPALIAGVAAPSMGAFAMPYYEDRAVQSLDELRVMVAHLAEAAWYLHSLGYVHCDVKRSNVRWDGQAAYLIDLDIAVCWREGDAPLHTAAGTLCWQAPELLTEAPALTSKVDIYGLGMVCLDEMLALSYANNHWRGTWPSIDEMPVCVCVCVTIMLMGMCSRPTRHQHLPCGRAAASQPQHAAR